MNNFKLLSLVTGNEMQYAEIGEHNISKKVYKINLIKEGLLHSITMPIQI